MEKTSHKSWFETRFQRRFYQFVNSKRLHDCWISWEEIFDFDKRKYVINCSLITESINKVFFSSEGFITMKYVNEVVLLICDVLIFEKFFLSNLGYRNRLHQEDPRSWQKLCTTDDNSNE